jgi:hypothetical protein
MKLKAEKLLDELNPDYTNTTADFELMGNGSTTSTPQTFLNRQRGDDDEPETLA